MAITTQSTNQGDNPETKVPQRAGSVGAPREGHGRPEMAEEERQRSPGGVAERGAEAARHAVKDEPSASPDWHGEEMAHVPTGQAEADAKRAAGRVPGNRRGEALAPDEYSEPVEMSPEEARAVEEQKRQAAAEDHEVEREEGGGAAPKDL